jgi:hypothetical protein
MDVIQDNLIVEQTVTQIQLNSNSNINKRNDIQANLIQVALSQ